MKNLIIGSKRSKSAFYHVGILEILGNLLKEYSSAEHVDILIEILDCLSSFAKSNNEKLLHRLIELTFIEQIFHLLTLPIDCPRRFYESSLRCLRTFYLPKSPDNHFNLTSLSFTLHTNQLQDEIRTKTFSLEQSRPIDLLFEHPYVLEIFARLLSMSKSIQISIIEILCCACVNNERQNQLVEHNFIPTIANILIENLDYHNQINEYLLGLSLKFFSTISFENRKIALQLSTITTKTHGDLCEIIAGLLRKMHRPMLISYHASKFFVHLCKTNVLPVDDPNVSNESLTTLIHLCTKSIVNRSISLYIECLYTLTYFLNGNWDLHHSAVYTEQFLSKLLMDIYTPKKVFGQDFDEHLLEEIRAAILTLLAILSSYHEDIKKRIAEQESRRRRIVQRIRRRAFFF